MSQRSLEPTSFREDPDAVSIGEIPCDWNFVVIVLTTHSSLDESSFQNYSILSRSYIPYFLTVESGKMRQTFLFA